MTPAEWITSRVAAVPDVHRQRSVTGAWGAYLVLDPAAGCESASYARCEALQRELAGCREDAVRYA